MKKLLLIGLLISANNAFGYVSISMKYTKEQMKTETQCSVIACRADDKGYQFQDTCHSSLNWPNYGQGQEKELLVVRSLATFGDCYCPCTVSYLQQAVGSQPICN